MVHANLVFYDVTCNAKARQTQIPIFIGYCSGACEEYSWLNLVFYDVTCNAKAHQTLHCTIMLNIPYSQTISISHQVECILTTFLTTGGCYVHT